MEWTLQPSSCAICIRSMSNAESELNVIEQHIIYISGTYDAKGFVCVVFDLFTTSRIYKHFD